MEVNKYYHESVLKDYRDKVESGVLSPCLVNPTPAGLRDECAMVCEERYQRKDEPVLRVFFGAHGDQAAYIRAIKKMDIDRFRPLVTYLTKEMKAPKEKVVELVAWLIGYEPRPYAVGKNKAAYMQVAAADHPGVAVTGQASGDRAGDNKEALPERTGDTLIVDDAAVQIRSAAPGMVGMAAGMEVEAVPATPVKEDDPVMQVAGIDRDAVAAGAKPEEPEFRPKPREWVTLSLGVVLLGISAYWIWPRNKGRVFAGGPQSCMFWNEDHYQAVSCNEQFGEDTLVIAANTDKLAHFRKITQPDTITLKSLGSVWYSKIDNKVEFFTGPGVHPTHWDRILKPVTPYIIGKYVHNTLPLFLLPPVSQIFL